jgi:hypothetical protein
MKNLILIAVLMLTSITANAQSTFMGVVHSKSTVVVQDLTTGIEYSFEVRKEIVVPIDNGHDYFIAVKSKNNTKHFILKQTTLGYLDDEFFDTASCNSLNIIYPATFEELAME